MSSQKRNADMDYWGLTAAQRVHYLRRVSAYWSRRAIHYGRESDKNYRTARKYALIAIIWALLSIAATYLNP